MNLTPSQRVTVAEILNTVGSFGITGRNRRAPRLILRARFTEEAEAAMIAELLGGKYHRRQQPGAPAPSFTVVLRGGPAVRVADEIIDHLSDRHREQLAKCIDELDELRVRRIARAAARPA